MKIGLLNKCHSNDKLLKKITSSRYHMEQKTFIEASYIYNIRTEDKFVAPAVFENLCAF